MNIKTTDINNLKPYEKNPRFNEHIIDKLANSIKQFGFKQPIVVDKDNVIIAGHSRYKAAQKLGLQHVPVEVADNLNKNQVKAYRIADNKIAELSTWDYSLLGEELQSLKDENFELELTGFELDEIESVINGWETDFDNSITPDNNENNLKSKITIKCNTDDKEDILSFIETGLREKGYTDYECS